MKTKSIRGNVLIITMITIAVISALAGVSFTMTSANSRLAARDLAMHQAQALAEGSLEVAFAQWKRYMDTNLNYSNSNPPTANALKFIADNPPSTHPALAASFTGFTFNGAAYKVVPLSRTSAADTTGPIVERTGDEVVYNVGTTSGSAAFSTKTNIFRYKATAEVTANPPGGAVTISLSRFFEVSWSPLVQNAIFYEDTMDIFPGARMDIIGDVHANGTLYGGHDSLHFWQKVSAVGDFMASYNPGDTRSTTTAYVAPNWDGTGGQTGQLSTQVSRQEVLGANPSQIVGNDPTNVNVQGGIHEIVQIPADSTTDPDGLKSRRFYNQAKTPPSNSKYSGVTILINPTAAAGSQVKVTYVPSPYDNAPPTGAALTSLTNAITSAVNVSGSTIKDFRQNANVTLHNVDVGAISAAIGTFDPFTKTSGNGSVLYVADTTVAALPTSDTATAIRLRNGASLTGDLTIASQNPVYVQGDYNTGLAPASDVMSNTIPTVNDALGGTGGNQSYYDSFTQGAGYNRKAAMIATDAINILSNNWNDLNSTNTSTSVRQATPTTMNTAFLTGNVPSAGGEYSGGVENLPRFHEKWTNVGFTVYGSFIELFKSREFTGKWSKASYDAPNRRWYFDTRFRKNPAPGTFIATTKQRAAWVRGTNTL